jgi:hypothetical protein
LTKKFNEKDDGSLDQFEKTFLGGEEVHASSSSTRMMTTIKPGEVFR